MKTLEDLALQEIAGSINGTGNGLNNTITDNTNNDSTAGFNALTDAIVDITGYKGTFVRYLTSLRSRVFCW
ncbi:hypothetical protein H6F39_16355 [Anabaena sp. FACHB-1250]|uniref:bluetail domain-containing putative surface protein n=1 Tax=Anabaena sp. FACHB-1250 TaxID=2692770 RepID=UPI001680E5F2|nr:bluetail domain-containing putative surface protein [Anabaena sp. FACHB-1250]MBD2142892.1 hypothetical protein [Anabaena sp. FACHB-1250]